MGPLRGAAEDAGTWRRRGRPSRGRRGRRRQAPADGGPSGSAGVVHARFGGGSHALVPARIRSRYARPVRYFLGKVICFYRTAGASTFVDEDQPAPDGRLPPAQPLDGGDGDDGRVDGDADRRRGPGRHPLLLGGLTPL